MKVIIDARALDLYPNWSHSEHHGGTETYVKKLASGLAGLGHRVHVVTPDLQRDEQRGDNEFWWAPTNFPTHADCVVMVPSLEYMEPYSAPLLIAATNGLGHYLGDNVAAVDAFPVFSETHAKLLGKVQGVPRDKCFVTGLGVKLVDYTHPDWSYEKWRDNPCCSGEFHTCKVVPGRIFVGNDPQRGLWHVLDIFDALKPLVPHATLHIGYDVQAVIDQVRWQAVAMAQVLLDCERRIHADPAITLLGSIPRSDLIREQLECQVHVWPSDPPNVGSQIHGITQMECAAAGSALVLSDIEAFPEVFGEVARTLPVPGTYEPSAERRVDARDWADAIAELMLDPEKWAEASRKSRALAEQHSWQRVIQNWESMFQTLADGLQSRAGEAQELATVH